MNHLKLFVIACGLLMVGVAGGYWLAQQRAGHANGEGDAARGGREVLYWHDPMVPHARFDEPGKSPFMDMDLVPVYADEPGAGAAVRIDPSVTQNLGVRYGRAQRTALAPRLEAAGSVAFDETRLEVVQARTEGYVTRLHVKTPLERVRRGQPLAEILSPAWLEAQHEYLALLDLEAPRAQAIREAARERLEVLGVPEAAIREIETQRRAQPTTTLTAPIDGVVSELAVREGATFMPGAPLFRINGLDTVWVHAAVPEAQVSMIAAGSSVAVHATAWPGEDFAGTVTTLLPDVDPATRTVPVRIVVENRDFKLSPGMYVALTLEAPAGVPQLTVPSEAVIMTGERNVVIVARAGGGFDVADVTVGAESGGRIAVLDGLDEGQRIVLSGQFLIDSEASLRSAVLRLGAGAADVPRGETQP